MTIGTTRRRAAVLALAVIVATLLPGAPRAKAQDSKLEYVHGDPSAEIQHLVELINRARLDPAGEGDRIFGDYGSANVATITSAFEANDPLHWKRHENRDAWKSYAPRPALAFNASLGAASHQWSVIMRARDTVAQSFGDAPSLLSRSVQQGYRPFWLGQLVQGYAQDVLHAHASWTIDWSVTRDPTTGRTTLFNREALINPADKINLRFVEIGAGVVVRNNPPPGGLGPKVVTVSLGTSQDDATRFVTGVCYDDKNRNGRYDPGEGIPKVRIDVDASDFFAISSTSGGYAVPVDGASGEVRVTASGIEGRASELYGVRTVTGDTLAFGRPENVKVDFVLPPRADPPPPTAFDGATGTVPAGGSASFDAVVGPIDAERVTVDDLDVELDVSHPDRSRLQVVLEAPDGTTATLWERGPGGADVRGSFDRTLRPLQPLSRFVGTAYEGTWRLHVADAAGAEATVNAWRLLVRPRWDGPLHARAPHLFVNKLKIKDSRKPLGDKLLLKCDVDVGEVLTEADAQRLCLILRESDAPYVERLRVPFAGPAGASSVIADGQTNVTFVPSRRGTSRAKLTLDLRGVDLPELPRDLRVDVALGDHVVSEDVRTKRGRFAGKRTAPDGGSLLIDRVKSSPHALGRKTDVRGRILQSRLSPLPGIIEARVGDASGLWRGGPKLADGSRLVYGAAGELRKFTLDTRSGKFTLRALSDHDGLAPDGTLDVSLWIGKAFEAVRVRPAADTEGGFAY